MRGKKRERIIRILLVEKKPLTKYRLAKLAECSYPWVHEFLKELEKKGLIIKTKVLNKEKLLDYWLKIQVKPKYKEYLVQEPMDLLQSVPWKYALTTYQADSLVEHFLFPSRTDIYILAKDAEKWHQALLKKGLYGKGNVRILFEDPAVFYKIEKIGGYMVVCLPQLILDLKKEGGVCGEAADKLLSDFKNV